MPMTLQLTDDHGHDVINWDPAEDTWWITGFNSNHQNTNEQDLTLRGTMNFEQHEDIRQAFYDMYRDDTNPDYTLTFDEKAHSVEIVWR